MGLDTIDVSGGGEYEGNIQVGVDYIKYGNGDVFLVTEDWLRSDVAKYVFGEGGTLYGPGNRNRNATYTGAGKYYHSSLEEMIRGLAGRPRPGLTYDERISAENERNARLAAKDYRDMLAMQQSGEARKQRVREQQNSTSRRDLSWWPTIERDLRYSPWKPDAFGVSIYGNIAGFSVGFSLAQDSQRNFGLYFTTSGGPGYTYFGDNPLKGVIGWGASFDLYDNRSNRPVLEDIAGQSYDFNGGLRLMGGYSVPIDEQTGLMASKGVHKISLGMGTGVRVTRSKTIRIW